MRAPFRPGCWNWANYDFDPHFDDQRGVALRTVMAMVSDLPNALPNAQVFAGDGVPGEQVEARAERAR
jgi:hypothetical protein